MDRAVHLAQAVVAVKVEGQGPVADQVGVADQGPVADQVEVAGKVMGKVMGKAMGNAEGRERAAAARLKVGPAREEVEQISISQ